MVDDLRLKIIMELNERVIAPLKRIGAGSKALSDQLRGTREELRQLEAQQQAISSFRALGQQFRVSAANSQALRQKLAALRAQTPANATEAQALARQIGATERALKKASITTDQQSQKLAGLRERMRSLGIRNVAAEEATLSSRMAETNRQIDQQRGKLERLAQLRSRHAKQMMHAGMAAGAGMAMQATGRRGVEVTLEPVRQFMAHEDAMLGVARQVPGARDEMGRLTAVYRTAEEQVRSLSGEIPLATTAIANMMTAAARMEVPTDQLAAQVKLAAEMAIAFDAVPDEVAESMGKVAKNFKIPVTEIRGLADAINYLDDNAISKGADIIDFLNRTSGVVSTVSMSAQQSAALGSTLLTLGERAETASTATNAIVQKLAAATEGTKKMKSAIAEIGMKPEAIQKGMSTDAIGTLLKVVDAIGKLPKDQRIGVMVEMIGLEHSDTLAKLVDKPDELRRQLELAQGTQAAGSMAREAQARYATLSAQWQMAKNRAFNLAAATGESLKPALVDTMNTAALWVERLRSWAQAHPTVVAGALKSALALSAITFALGAVLVPLAVVVAKLALLRFLLKYLAISSPVFGLLGRGIGLLVGGTGKLVIGIGKLWRGIGMLARWGGHAFGLLARGAAALTPLFMSVGKAALAFALTPLGAALVLLAGAAYLVWRNWDGIKGGLAIIWQQIKDGAQSLWQSISDAGTRAWRFLVDLKGRFVSAGAALMQGLVSGISAGLGAVRDGIFSAGERVVGWFKEKLGIKSPSRVFMALGEFIPAGAALGIERGSPRLQAAALAMAALPALSMPTLARADAEAPAARALGIERGSPRLQAAALAMAALTALSMPTLARADAEAPAARALVLQAPAERPRPSAEALPPLRPPRAPPQGAEGTGGGTGAGYSFNAGPITITINAAPGQDPQAIARAVSAELDRRARRRGADVRAQLSDID